MTEADARASELIPVELRLGALLDALEAQGTSDAGGVASAVVGAFGASLVAMVARSSPGWAGASGAAAQAVALRDRLLDLGRADAAAYDAPLRALDAPPGERQEQRNFALSRVLAHAAEVPLRIAETAADVAELAADAAEQGDRAVQADAAAAAALAEGVVRATAALVAANLTTSESDDRMRQVDRLVESAQAARSRATEGLK